MLTWISVKANFSFVKKKKKETISHRASRTPFPALWFSFSIRRKTTRISKIIIGLALSIWRKSCQWNCSKQGRWNIRERKKNRAEWIHECWGAIFFSIQRLWKIKGVERLFVLCLLLRHWALCVYCTQWDRITVAPICYDRLFRLLK